MKKLFRHLTSLPWFILLSRVCRIAGLLCLTMAAVHFARFSPVWSDGGSELLRIMNSSWWVDRILFAAGLVFTQSGLVLTLGRNESRGKILLGFLLWLILSAFIVMSRSSASVESDNLWGDCMFIGWPVLAGIYGGMFEELYGRKAWTDWAASKEQSSPPVRLSAVLDPPGTAQNYKFRDWMTAFIPLFMTLGTGMTGIVEPGRGSCGVWLMAAAIALGFMLELYCLSLCSRTLCFSVAFSRIVSRFAILLAVLSLAHFVHAASFQEALLTFDVLHLFRSRWWPDQLLCAVLMLFFLISILLTLFRFETKKTARKSLLIAIPLTAVACSLLQILPNYKTSWLWLGNLVLFSWSLWAAVQTMLFARRFGKAAVKRSQDELNSKQQKRMSPSSVMPVAVKPPAPLTRTSTAAARPKPSTPTPPPKDPTKKEQELRQLKEQYEKRLLDEGRQAPPAASKLLKKARPRLFPGKSTLATLGGQRQLLVWLTAGVHCLNHLKKLPASRELMKPGLPDDPDVFVPLLGQISEEAEQCLNSKLWEEDEHWKKLDPETLANAWFALRMYARMSPRPEIFELAADGLAEHMTHRADAMQWLNEQQGGE